jgi:predicted esterase
MGPHSHVFTAVVLTVAGLHAGFLPAAAGAPGKVQTYAEGSVLVPAKPAAGRPVLVIAEHPRRAAQLLGMMAPALKATGVIAVAPKLVMKNRAVDGAKSMKQVDALVQRVKGGVVKPGKLYAFSFSASGPMGYQLALKAAPTKFAGLIVAASFPPRSQDLGGATAKKVPILLVHGEADQMFGPQRAKQVEQVLKSKGFKFETKIVKGADHMGMAGAYAGQYLVWITGAKPPPVKARPKVRRAPHH